jgi:hypothetical protein
MRSPRVAGAFGAAALALCALMLGSEIGSCGEGGMDRPSLPLSEGYYAQNVLLNPGFELGDECWWDEEWYPSATRVYAGARQGGWCLRVGPEGERRAQQLPAVRPLMRYRLSAWGRVSEAGEKGTVCLEGYDRAGARFEHSIAFAGLDYECRAVEFTTSADVCWIRVVVRKDDGPGYFYVDDVSLVEAVPQYPRSPGNTTYYVDCGEGDDSNSGMSPGEAWRTLDKINSIVFASGDRILFRAGQAWSGCLQPSGSGEPDAPIRLHAFGDGAKPLINGAGGTAAVYLHNQQYWEIKNLELCNRGSPAGRRCGVYVVGEDFGTLSHIHLVNLNVRDVNGLQHIKANGGIIFEVRGKTKETRFNDVLIEGCSVAAVDRSGIMLVSSWWDRHLEREAGHWDPSSKVVVRGNAVSDVGGDGIVVCCAKGPLIERNIARDCNKRSGRHCGGIWPWACDDAVIQFNEAYLTRTTRDSEGFDSDYFSRRTVIQYNYSHDNEGGFVLVCGNGDVDGFNDGTIVRYNISQNDRNQVFMLSGCITNTLIHNNTIYIAEGLTTNPVNSWDWGGVWPENTYFFNNVFYNLGTGEYRLGGCAHTVFEHNLFYGHHPESEPADGCNLTCNPELIKPGSGTTGRDTVKGYKLRPGSPCIDAGKTVPNNGGRDYWGNPVPSGAGTDIGACEYPGSEPSRMP